MAPDRPSKTRRGVRDWRQCTKSIFFSSFPTSQLKQWAESLRLATPEELSLSLPKGYLTYEPLAIFPSGSLSSEPGTLLHLLTAEERDILWRIVLQELSKKSGMNLTHLAVNAGIPVHKEGKNQVSSESGHAATTSETAEDKNILRSPTGLRELYGHFGSADGSAYDFDEALWVWTRQNGIWQTWAPKWTMFSRGNVVEKARLLDFHKAQTAESSKFPHRILADLKTKTAVDMYAGIGYFVFSYARLGLRVLGWELNPWSIEGLRRGALRNGWAVKVVQGADLSALSTIEATSGNEQITIFAEDNCHAQLRLEQLRAANSKTPGKCLTVVHVNGGLLPTSEPSWASSFAITRISDKAWLHLHDNVGIDDIEARRQELEQRISAWAIEEGLGRTVAVEHTMKVKTFAPGVWHCVFDVYLSKGAG
ncbi:S-adenosylmethionine-dependent methyltransferase [Ceratocystis pirilliformis]|uniref:tRNA wybutosine-synthesizing protein 2 n=1 Tax=Ceratocystis pirilliformis TaxID=259994 RepID=A0ABR3ZJ75_9PEZI